MKSLVLTRIAFDSKKQAKKSQFEVKIRNIINRSKINLKNIVAIRYNH